MGVGLLPRLRHRRLHAGHAGVAAPVEIRQRARVAEKVAALVARHLEPIDAADILAPADDLADEALRRVERHRAGAPRGLDLAADAERVEQADVQILRDDGMIEEGFARQHRILVVAELRQRALHEGGERRFRVGARDGEPERRQIAEVPAEAGLDQRQHLPGDGIGCALPGARHEQVSGRGLPVVGVEIPLAARRLVAVHQQSRPAPHVAVEMFQAQLLAARGPGPERLGRAQEAVVRQDVDRQREPRLPACLHLQDPPFAGLGDDDAFRPVAGDGVLQLRGEAAARIGRLQRHIVDRPAQRPQFLGEMAHGGKDEGDLLLVMPHIGRLVLKLGHEHAIAGRIAAGEAAERGRELIAQDQDEMADAGHHKPARRGRRATRRSRREGVCMGGESIHTSRPSPMPPSAP